MRKRRCSTALVVIVLLSSCGGGSSGSDEGEPDYTTAGVIELRHYRDGDFIRRRSEVKVTRAYGQPTNDTITVVELLEFTARTFTCNTANGELVDLGYSILYTMEQGSSAPEPPQKTEVVGRNGADAYLLLDGDNGEPECRGGSDHLYLQHRSYTVGQAWQSQASYTTPEGHRSTYSAEFAVTALEVVRTDMGRIEAYRVEFDETAIRNPAYSSPYRERAFGTRWLNPLYGEVAAKYRLEGYGSLDAVEPGLINDVDMVVVDWHLP